MPGEVKISVITDAGAHPHIFMLIAYAFGQAYQGISVVIKVSDSARDIGYHSSIAIQVINLIDGGGIAHCAYF